MNELTREQKVAAARTRMAELAAKFLDRSATDLRAMREGMARLSAGDVGPLADIRHLAHRMVGTGATLGFDRLSGCASRIERLTEGIAPGTLPDEASRQQLEGAISALEAALGDQRGS